jgi:hypothetical protein
MISECKYLNLNYWVLQTWQYLQNGPILDRLKRLTWNAITLFALQKLQFENKFGQ